MIIYHGSKDIIEKPIFGFGRKDNDYGLGFYCSPDLEMAKEWSVDIERDGYANTYQLDEQGLTILNLNDTSFCILHWLALLLSNREFDMSNPLAEEAKEYLIKNFSINIKKADVIIGYRADDSYFSFARDFLNGAISYEQLGRAMRLGKLGEQYVIKSGKAFSRLCFVQAEEVKSEIYYPKKQFRDSGARKDYFNSKKNPRKPKSLYITTILDEEIKPDDERL